MADETPTVEPTVVEPPPPPMLPEEQDAKLVEDNKHLLDALGELDDRQKVLILLRYIQYYGSLPAKAEEPPPPAPAPTTYQGV